MSHEQALESKSNPSTEAAASPAQPHSPPSQQLPAKQVLALEAIKSGSSFPQAAQTAGVCRATLYRWLQVDPNFRAAYNLWQQEVCESSRARLLGMADKAVQTVEEAITRGETRAALTVLREMGVLRRRQGQLTDPDLLDMQMQFRHHALERRLATARATQLLQKAGLSEQEAEEYIRSGGKSSRIAPQPTSAADSDDAIEEGDDWLRSAQMNDQLGQLLSDFPSKEDVDRGLDNRHAV